MKIRRNQEDLTASDLSTYPIWEFAYGEMTERYMLKPSKDIPPVDISVKRYLVSATFVFTSGLEKPGFIKPLDTTDNKYSHVPEIDLAATILTDSGHVYFWFGMHKPARENLDLFYSRLQCSPHVIFPIQVKSNVDLLNGVGTVVIDGFRYCEKMSPEDSFHMQLSDTKLIVYNESGE